MNLEFKTNKYFSKKMNKDVSEEILIIKKKGDDEVGIGIRDYLVGNFKFQPRVRTVTAKTGRNAGSEFKAADGVMIIDNLPSRYEGKLNQFGNVKVDFTKTVKDFEHNHNDALWETHKYIFYLRPYVDVETQKTKFAISMSPLLKLSKDVVEAAIFLQGDETSFTDTDLSVQKEDGSKLKVPRWALLLPKEQLVELIE